MFSMFTKEQQDSILAMEKAFEGFNVPYDSPVPGNIVKDFLSIVKDSNPSMELDLIDYPWLVMLNTENVDRCDTVLDVSNILDTEEEYIELLHLGLVKKTTEEALSLNKYLKVRKILRDVAGKVMVEFKLINGVPTKCLDYRPQRPLYYLSLNLGESTCLDSLSYSISEAFGVNFNGNFGDSTIYFRKDQLGDLNNIIDFIKEMYGETAIIDYLLASLYF